MGKIILMVFLIFPLSLNAKEIEIFYKGFWSHSPFPTPLERLSEVYLLHSIVREESVPGDVFNILFSGYKENTKHSLGIEYLFHLRKFDDEGNLIGELGGGRDIMFDLKNDTFKRLTENEKIILNNYIKDVSHMESDFIIYREIGE